MTSAQIKVDEQRGFQLLHDWKRNIFNHLKAINGVGMR